MSAVLAAVCGPDKPAWTRRYKAEDLIPLISMSCKTGCVS